MLDIQNPCTGGGVWGRFISIIWNRSGQSKDGTVVIYVKWRCTRPRNDPGCPEHGYPPCAVFSGPQSRQSARLFLQSSELRPPTPSPAGSVYPPPPFSSEGDTLACRRGGGGSHFGGGDRHCGALGIYVLRDPT
jgi:hypothetical protein